MWIAAAALMGLAVGFSIGARVQRMVFRRVFGLRWGANPNTGGANTTTIVWNGEKGADPFHGR